MILYSKWLSLPLSTRNDIAYRFGIAKTGPTHVANDQILSDGYKIADIENALTVDAIKTYLGSNETDLATLFDTLANTLYGVPIVLSEVVPVVEAVPEPPAAPKPRKSRVISVKTKAAKKRK